MKQLLITLILFTSICFAQENVDPNFLVNPKTGKPDKDQVEKVDKDSSDYAQLYAKVNKLQSQIKELQSNLYEGEKQLEALYKDFNLYGNLMQAKKELIEAKKLKEKQK